MKSVIDNLKKLIHFEKKYTMLPSKIFQNGGFSTAMKPNWNVRNYNTFANEAFVKNIVVHKSINTIAKSASSIDFLLYKKDLNGDRVEIKKHNILDLLKTPNIYTSGVQLIEDIFIYQLLSGNSYILCNKSENGTINELYTLRPDRVAVLTDGNGQLSGYKYAINGKNINFPFDQKTGACDILHLKNFHPLDDLYGLSAAESAHYSIEQHNEALKWNKALLENGARPSGAVVVKQQNGGGYGNLSDEQYERLKDQIRQEFTGSSNAGKFMILEGGLEWQEIGLSPKDMDFLETKNSAARDIALAFGVPAQMLGIKGDNTYSNMAEARMAFWEETIIPLLTKFCNSMSKYLSFHFNEEVQLDFDIDKISALSSKRESYWNTINSATFLSDDEKRKLLGF